MYVAGFPRPHTPRLAAEQRHRRLEVGERLSRPSLRKSQPAPRGRNQNGPHARRPTVLREQVKQALRLVQLARLDGDVR